MKAQITVRHPNECSEKELNAFVTVAAKGEEVERQHIERGAEGAAALLWIEENGSPFAVCALKTPRKSYRDGVFRKAAVPTECSRFPLELGYIFGNKPSAAKGTHRHWCRRQ